ncbi:MAG: hypothetical protein HKO66_06145 [Saprospiraceae bacterium]|nr:hypothetical protein [Bacteroidia bacterium]NNE13864.1 hypothetical protein [Saprospiraceae bacterium]NNL91792.1 hypothetical protein [Saprospiraceae bacterium]
MKKIIFTFLIFGSFINIASSQQFNFGAGAQLIFDGSIFGIQGKALYEIDDTWRGAGGFTLHLKSGVNWTIDADAQYKLLEVSDNFELAPFAGLSITNFAFDTELGINLGAFIDFVPDDSYHIYIEPKINIGGYESFAVAGGILF